LDYYRPTPFEVATGWVHGLLAPTPAVAGSEAPLEALADLLRPALAAPTCYVAFSGGRDSSAILAVATLVARRDGFADPVPVTALYPDIPEADESEWQEAVVQHLGLRDWLRLEFHDENDLLGPAARASLRQRGQMWPAALHTKVNLLTALSAGTLLTGEGGDEVFGARRAAPWPHLKKGTAIRRRRAARGALGSLLPRAARRRRAVAKWRQVQLQPWLRPVVAEEHCRALADDESCEPLRWDRSLLWVTRRRSAAVLGHNYQLLAAEYGVTLRTPLLEPQFLAALGRVGGRWGYTGRTAVMSALFGELLPRSVIERKTKAVFNRAFLGASTRAFARAWDGSGVDPDLVDVERLRQEWLSERPSAISGPLLQAAWLYSDAGKPSNLVPNPA
jgi:asparagine synthase (glutamine-hydrolysing)